MSRRLFEGGLGHRLGHGNAAPKETKHEEAKGSQRKPKEAKGSQRKPRKGSPRKPKQAKGKEAQGSQSMTVPLHPVISRIHTSCWTTRRSGREVHAGPQGRRPDSERPLVPPPSRRLRVFRVGAGFRVGLGAEQ
jgi:hypothetical protein